MASPLSGPRPIPGTFTAHERFLVEKTEEAVRDGKQLEDWMRAQPYERIQFPLDLKKSYTLPNRPYGYFGTMQLNGRAETVMGARQEVDFGPVTTANPILTLTNFVMGEFLPRAHWTYPDGHPGGFSIEQSIYRSAAGEYGKFGEGERTGVVDWRRLGTEFDWVLLTVQIHDFVMNFGPIVKRFKEAACVAPQKDFVRIADKPAKGYAFEIAVGYPFVAFAPIPNVFGFGPGKFGVAVKTYTFRLTDAGELQVVMNFAAAPRCQKVFDFGKSVPDPIYGGAALLHKLTFGAFKTEPFHNQLDANMLGQHCRVHQALMEGVAGVWREWMKGGRIEA
jgi:hypothetical protein